LAEYALSKTYSKRRRIEDGRLCGEKFLDLGNKEIIDTCADGKSPDGRMTGREWCFKADGEPGQSKWGFCSAALEYDKVRNRV